MVTANGFAPEIVTKLRDVADLLDVNSLTFGGVLAQPDYRNTEEINRDDLRLLSQLGLVEQDKDNKQIRVTGYGGRVLAATEMSSAA